MMASVALIALVIMVEARPVYLYAASNLLHTKPTVAGLWLGFGGAGLLCLAATFVPIRIAVKRMKELER
jgi:hypothetical protein